MLRERLKGCTPEAIALVNALLTFDPEKRPSARRALGHKYFTEEEPRACRPEMLQTAPEVRNEGLGGGGGKRIVVGREREEEEEGKGAGGAPEKDYLFDFDGGERKRRRK